MHEMTNQLKADIERNNGSVDIYEPLQTAVGNVINSMIFGSRFDDVFIHLRNFLAPCAGFNEEW